MGLMRFQIRCLACAGETLAEHCHGPEPWRGDRVHRQKPLRCWNRCLRCGRLYEALPCGAKERKHQRQLERFGQTTMFGGKG